METGESHAGKQKGIHQAVTTFLWCSITSTGHSSSSTPASPDHVFMEMALHTKVSYTEKEKAFTKLLPQKSDMSLYDVALPKHTVGI